MAGTTPDAPRRLPLHDLHAELGAKTAPFAGWEMPVSYPAGALKEHAAAREGAALFDVSHMGQAEVRGDAPGAALEALIPANLADLAPGRQRYGLLTNAAGGIDDDLMTANLGDRLHLVLNAANARADMDLLRAGLPGHEVVALDRALLALQGPEAEAMLAPLCAAVAGTRFMDAIEAEVDGAPCVITRSGYTGEDGFEISVPLDAAERIARALVAAGAQPAGLAARDSLRLEAGLCLHGSDMDATVTPAEAALGWSIPKVRRGGGARAGGFPGADRILEELETGPARRRVGLRPEGRAPVRAGATLHLTEDGPSVGAVRSGGWGATVGGPVAMGMLPPDPPARVFAEVRGRRLPCAVVPLPFVPARFKR